MIEIVRRAIDRFGIEAAGRRIGAAVSGGADSVALLTALSELRGALGIELTVLHVNHRLRGAESDADEEFVRRLAAERGLACSVGRAPWETPPQANIEERCRRLRYEFFADSIHGGVCDLVATGHTRSDQAETLLLRLFRGAGVGGLVGIQPLRPPGVIRPLLDVSRSEVEEFLKARGLPWREDSSNADRRFARNRLRRDLFPRLIAEWNPRIETALSRLAAQARDEEDYWAGELAGLHDRLVQEEGAVEFSAGWFRGLHPALQRRLLRYAARLASEHCRTDFDRIEEARAAIVDRRSGGGCDLGGWRLRLSLDRVRLSSPAKVSTRPAATLIEPPARAIAPDGRTHICIRAAAGAPKVECYDTVRLPNLDWSRLSRPLTLRGWQAGDRLRTNLERAPRKLADMLQEAGVASWHRSLWPVLSAGSDGAAVWSRGFGASADFVAGRRCATRLEVLELDFDGQIIQNIEDWTTSLLRRGRR